jgi:hypothetical protein
MHAQDVLTESMMSLQDCPISLNVYMLEHTLHIAMKE